jgi:hypothetical protein
LLTCIKAAAGRVRRESACFFKGATDEPQTHPPGTGADPDFPDGSAGHGYEFVAPLDAKGRLDSSAWPQAKAICTVRRFWNGTPDEHGVLIHGKDGRWSFSYAPGDDDDEPIFKFDKHLFTVGEYVTVTEHDAVARPFRIVEVAPAIVRA